MAPMNASPATVPPTPAPGATRRMSTRGFLDSAVADDLLERLLIRARLAPSAANLQPGHIIQLKGSSRARLTQALLDARAAGHEESEDYAYFPRPMPLALRRRQVAAAQALYGALGIERHDRAGREAQFDRNFQFFDAPVALLLTIDRAFGAGGYLDLGMLLHSLMLSAHEEGLGSCVIGALASYPNLIRQTLGLADEHHIVCGVAIGYADPHAGVNDTATSRIGPDEFFTVLD